MSEGAFYDRMWALIPERRPELPEGFEPTTQLWQAGYMGSFGSIESLPLRREITGRPVQIGAHDLPDFFPMKGIFEGFVGG